jgi:hypothetical protein
MTVDNHFTKVLMLVVVEQPELTNLLKDVEEHQSALPITLSFPNH